MLPRRSGDVDFIRWLASFLGTGEDFGGLFHGVFFEHCRVLKLNKFTSDLK